MNNTSEILKQYRMDLEEAKEKYRQSFKSDSCKAILESYYEVQKIKSKIQKIIWEKTKDDKNSKKENTEEYDGEDLLENDEYSL